MHKLGNVAADDPLSHHSAKATLKHAYDASLAAVNYYETHKQEKQPANSLYPMKEVSRIHMPLLKFVDSFNDQDGADISLDCVAILRKAKHYMKKLHELEVERVQINSGCGFMAGSKADVESIHKIKRFKAKVEEAYQRIAAYWDVVEVCSPCSLMFHFVLC